MKKIKYILLLCTLTFLLTGCVKYNANMDIKKDKSMDFSIIYAFDSSLFEDQKLLEDKDKKELEDRGFTVTDYSQDKMKGFTISKKIKNIDDVSSTYDSEYSLSGILDDKSENAYIFKVKKGLIKNTYTAKFKFDASDSDLNNPTDDSSSDLDSDSDFSFEDDSDSSSFDSESDLSDMDFSSMMSNMDLSFNVTLPYSAKSNNASTVNNDGKKLSWNLSSNQVEFIEFEFELYINGELLKYIPHTNKNLPTILTKDYGINKKYEISSNKDINKVVLYYLGFDNNFIPITKYVNDKREKLEIIVEDLSSNYIFYERRSFNFKTRRHRF